VRRVFRSYARFMFTVQCRVVTAMFSVGRSRRKTVAAADDYIIFSVLRFSAIIALGPTRGARRAFLGQRFQTPYANILSYFID